MSYPEEYPECFSERPSSQCSACVECDYQYKCENENDKLMGGNMFIWGYREEKDILLKSEMEAEGSPKPYRA